MDVKGRRVYPDAEGNLAEFKNGDYGKDGGGRWFALPPETPGAHGCGIWLNNPNYSWDVVEHEDGTITVSPSIDAIGYWHGYLQKGIWKKC